MKRILLIVLFAIAASGQMRAPDAEQFVGPPRGTPLEGAALDSRTQAVGSMVRCPVCQGLSIADSPSEMAVNMKRQVRELLSRGFSEDQILDYFEHSYGQFVLLKPKFRGVTSFVWTLPVLVLILGVGIVFMKMRKLDTPGAPPPPPPSADDDYLERVRAMVKQ
jgi:cytochrome c-type biogenesis protein CcmH